MDVCNISSSMILACMRLHSFRRLARSSFERILRMIFGSSSHSLAAWRLDSPTIGLLVSFDMIHSLMESGDCQSMIRKSLHDRICQSMILISPDSFSGLVSASVLKTGGSPTCSSFSTRITPCGTLGGML